MSEPIPERLPRGIRRLPSGRYRVRHRGQDRRARTYADAVELYNRMHAATDPRRAPAGRVPTLHEYLIAWVGRRNDLAPSSQRKYDDNLRAYIRGYPIARRRLDSLSYRDFEAYFRALEGHTGSVTGRPLAPNSILAIRRMLNTAMKSALREGLIASNPIALALGPKATKPRTDPPTRPQVERILAAFEGDRLEVLYWVAADTGLRIGEALGLTWADLELEGHYPPLIRVRASLDSAERRRRAPKTPNAIRDLPISDELADRLRAHRSRQAVEAQGPRWANDLGLVFPTRLGTPTDAGNVAKWVRRAVEASGVAAERRAAGMAPLTFHDFRHAFATHAVARGVQVGPLSRYLGHASVSTTLNLYYHPTGAELAQVIPPQNGGAKGAQGAPDGAKVPTIEMGHPVDREQHSSVKLA